MQKRFAAEETHVSNPSFVQNGERLGELVSVQPAKVATAYFSACEIAKIACSIACIGYSNVA
jgi:hypothetical protein